MDTVMFDGSDRIHDVKMWFRLSDRWWRRPFSNGMCSSRQNNELGGRNWSTKIDATFNPVE